LILVAGVAELYQGDLDLGRVAVERLATEPLGDDVLVEELSYGAVAASQRLQDLRPDALVLVAAHPRDRLPGTVERRVLGPADLPPEQLQAAVGDAVTGYVTIDLLVEVATALGALPPAVVAIEVEPASVRPAEQMTPQAQAALEEVLRRVRSELRSLRASPTRG
jgi:Ni,Fe-hydrogenase maturation factor